jgi:hypothetical protein
VAKLYLSEESRRRIVGLNTSHCMHVGDFSSINVISLIYLTIMALISMRNELFVGF